MSAAGYICTTEGAVALAAGVAKTIIGVKAQAAAGLQLKSFFVSFDGVTAADIPVLVELLYATWATNSPGTASTTTSPRQKYGRVLAAGFTSGKTWTTEPTVLTPLLPEFLLAPDKGLIVLQDPLGQEADCAFGEGFVLRCTAPAIVNVRSGFVLERI
jgi:hypothetical protein